MRVGCRRYASNGESFQGAEKQKRKAEKESRKGKQKRKAESRKQKAEKQRSRKAEKGSGLFVWRGGPGWPLWAYLGALAQEGLVGRTYDSRNLLSTIAYAGGTIDTRTYDAGGRLSRETLGNGQVVTRTYMTGDNLPASINNSAVGNYGYGWDSNKNKTSETITGAMSGYGFSVPTGGMMTRIGWRGGPDIALDVWVTQEQEGWGEM